VISDVRGQAPPRERHPKSRDAMSLEESS
jgi:hypothetical protein